MSIGYCRDSSKLREKKRLRNWSTYKKDTKIYLAKSNLKDVQEIRKNLLEKISIDYQLLDPVIGSSLQSYILDRKYDGKAGDYSEGFNVYIEHADTLELIEVLSWIEFRVENYEHK